MKKKIYAPSLLHVKNQWAEQPSEPFILELREKLSKISELCDFRIETKEIKENLADTEIILGSVKINKELLGYAKKLEFVQTVGVGFNQIDVEACTKQEVLVSNVAEILFRSSSSACMGINTLSNKKDYQC